MTGTLRVGEPAGRWVLLATVGGSGLAMLDSTVVNVALAHLGRDLHADFAALQWVINGYTLSLAALILLGGALGDRFGRRRVFVIGVIWFAVASALCGLAPTAGLLIAARVLQGMGGALLTPGSLALIAAAFREQDRSRAVGMWSGLGGVAGALGPFLGGALVAWNWRAVFWINVPVAAAVVLITLRHVPESRDPAAGSGIDLPGAALAVLGLGALTFALTEGGAGMSATVWVTGLVGLLALAGFLVVEARSPHPLVPLSLFANGLFRAANVVTLLVYGALGVFFFLLVLQMQTVAGFSPTISGTGLLPVTVLMLLLSARAGALADRIGPRLPMTVGPLLAATGFLLATRVGPGAHYVTEVLPAAVALGLGLSCTVAPLTATVLASADEHHAGIASGINNAIARSAGLLAVAVIPVAAGLGGDTNYTDPVVFGAGFRHAMLIGAGLLVLGAALSAVLVRNPVAPATDQPPATKPTTRPATVDGIAPGRPIRLELARCPHCGVGSPQLHPGAR
jgi:EmrB/QacA subfamily drug resistance transporter